MQPQTDEKHVGIEFEIVSDCNFDEARSILSNEFSELTPFVRVGTDRSIIPSREYDAIVDEDDEELDEDEDDNERLYGLEIRFISPISLLSERLSAVSSLLTRLNATVNKSCGLHVHLDMRHRRPTKSYKNLIRCQDILMAAVHPDRRTNQRYCKKVDIDESMLKKMYFPENGKPDYFGVYIGRGGRAANGNVNPTSDRYTAINAAAWYKFRTIEIRLHQGSIDMDEVMNWVSLLNTIVDARTISTRVDNLTVLKRVCRAIKPSTVSYLKEVMDKYSA